MDNMICSFALIFLNKYNHEKIYNTLPYFGKTFQAYVIEQMPYKRSADTVNFELHEEN